MTTKAIINLDVEDFSNFIVEQLGNERAFMKSVTDMPPGLVPPEFENALKRKAAERIDQIDNTINKEKSK